MREIKEILNKKGKFEDIVSKIRFLLGKDLVSEFVTQKDNVGICMFLCEKYDFPVLSNIPLSILVIENDGEVTIVMDSVGGEQGAFRLNQSRNRKYLKSVKSEIEKI